MTEQQHKINYKNIGMVLLLGLVAINIGMSQYRSINIQIPNVMPSVFSNDIAAAAPSTIVLNSSLAGTMILSSVVSIGIVCVVLVFTCMMIYALSGLGGMAGRR